jgi:peptide/nickel transport system substrate-binding protein
MLIRAALLASALAFATPAFAQPKTTLSVGIAAQDIGQLDPHFAVSTIDRIIAAWMFNGLVRFRPAASIRRNSRAIWRRNGKLRPMA